MMKSLSPQFLVSKLYRYIQEVGLCFRMGDDLRNRLLLASASIQFHLMNGLWDRGYLFDDLAKRYRVRLANHIINLELRTYSGDIFVFYETFLDRCYRIPEFLAREVKYIVDLGAHIGLATCFLYQYFPQARFICVESNPKNVGILRYNLSFLGDQIQVIEGAISDRSGEVLFDNTCPSWGGKIETIQQSGLKVRCFSMEEMISTYNLKTIDILKIDIEGTEKKLFGTQNEWLRKVKVIIIELHEGYSLKNFEEDVGIMGFKVFPPNSKYGNRMVFAVAQDILKLIINLSYDQITGNC